MELNQDARAVLDAMREGINIIDAEGRIIFGNKAYLDFLSKETGIGIGSIEGQYLRDLRPGVPAARGARHRKTHPSRPSDGETR